MELKRTDSIKMVPISIWSLLEVIVTHGLRRRLGALPRALRLRLLVPVRALAREETRERCNGSEGPCGEARVWTPLPYQRGVPGALNSRTTPIIPAILCGAA